MKKILFFLLGLILGMAIIWGITLVIQNRPEVQEKGIDSVKTDETKKEEEVKKVITENKNITVTKPLVDEEISSPISIEGSAKGTWFFEAVSFVKIVDEKGTELGSGSIKAVGNWMTEDFVPFKGQISFDKTSSKTGFLIFENSNPSGLKENAQEFKLPIKFQQ